MYWQYHVRWIDDETLICLKHKFKYRKDPVPYTGRIGGYCSFRSPKTIPEKIKYIECYKDLQRELRKEYPANVIKLVRAKRSHALLPDPWDDVYRSNCTNKSWKNNKKHRRQWDRIKR